MNPLPGRECGGCTQCCLVLPVNSPELTKQSGVLCTHCDPGVGCAIHATRFPVCRSFQCGWRLLPIVPDDLRPDRSGILVVADEDNIPPGYRDMAAVKFVITGGRAALERTSFLECLAGLIHGGAPTFLTVPGPPGSFFAKAFLNERLKDAVAQRNAAAMIGLLMQIMDELENGPFEPVTFAPQTN